MAELTVYPEAGDGVVGNSNATWSTCRGAATGDYADYTTTENTVVKTRYNGSTYWIYRGFFPFDTSALGSGATVSAATLSIYGTATSDGLGITPDANIYSFAPAATNALANGDYDAFGTTDLSTTIAYGGWTVSGYNDFVLNASGLAEINASGITKLGMRNRNYDVLNVTPTWTSFKLSFFSGYYADQTGTANDPKLVVEHTGAGGGGATVKNFMMTGVGS